MTLDFDKSDMGQDWGNQDYEDISSDIGSSASMASSGDDCDDADYTTMAKFVPTLLLERLRTVGEATMTRRSSLGMDSESGATDGTNFPKVHELDAAVMVVDVSGFSSMCERFAQGQVPEDDGKQKKPGIRSLRNTSGGNQRRRTDAYQAEIITRLYRLANDDETKGFGAERVREALNDALGALISTVERHGGDVLRIAGDALIVLFHHGGVDILPQDFADLCAACSRCGWDCATSGGVGGGKNRKRVGDDGMKGLKVHAGIGCGRVRCFHVGSDQRGWQLVVSGKVFATQVANALDASRAGEVVVSEEVWQYLAGHGWGASIVRDDRGSSTSGLRLLKWPPDVWNTVEMTTLDEEEIDSSPDVEHESVSGRGTTAAPAAPFFGSAGALSSPPAQSFAGIPSVFGQAGTGAEAAGNGLPDPSKHARRMSLGAAGALCLGARWCPSRKRLGLLEEVETGVLTMLSKDVRRALKGYCPQPIRQGLVAERIGLLAWIQRVAVLFVGLRFEEVEPRGGSGQSQSANQRVGKRGELLPPSVGETETTESGAQLRILQASFSLMQAVVASHEGIIKELSVDDKGTVLVVGFGLYPQAGLLPAARATLCAMECTDRLRHKGLARCHAGIATGPVFCGSLGSRDRREFTMVSETVNLAQRIMSARKNRRLLSKTQAACVQQVLNKIEGNVHRKPRRGGDHGNAKAGASKASPATSMQPSRAHVATGTRTNVDPKRPLSEGGRKSPSLWKTISSATSWDKGDYSAKSVPTVETPLVIPPRIPHHQQPTKRGDAPAATSSSPPIGFRKKLSAVAAGAIEALSSFEASTKAAAAPASASAVAAPVPAPAATAVTPSMVPDSLEEKGFNQWVVMEHETLKEARKTQQLAFLELEAVKVKGKTSKVTLFAPGLSYMVKAALRDPDVPVPLQSMGPVSFPTGIIFGGGGTRFSGEGAGFSGASANGGKANGCVSNAFTMSRSNSQEVAKRYRLDIPEKGELFAEEGRLWRQERANTAVPSPSDDSDQDEMASESQLTSTSFLPVSPTPDVAAKEMGSWRGLRGFTASGKLGRTSGDVGGGSGGDVLSRNAFETLLPCIFHAESVHDEVSHILWARTGGRVSYLSEVCRSLIGVAMTGTEWDVSVGDVGEDGMWRLRLNEFAHVLKLASQVPNSVEGELDRRLDKLPYTARQVVLQAICVTVVAGVGKVELLLHLLANVVPFKEYWEAVVSQQTSLEQAARHRSSHRSHRRRALNRRATSTSPVPPKRRPRATVLANAIGADEGAVGDHGVGCAMGNGGIEPIPVVVITGQLAGGAEEDDHGLRRRAGSEVLRSVDSTPIVGRSRSETEGSAGSLGLTLSPRTDGDTSVEGAGRKALLSCLRMLEEGGFLTVCDGGKEFVCDDAMLIDKVYASTPFKLRKALHKEAAEWIAARHRKSFSDRAEVMPILISHLTQAHEEGRAQAMLAVLKVLGGRFMDRWVLRHVRRIVGIRENRNPTAMEHLAMFVLPALPSLRGLSKAIRGAEIAGVVVTVALRLRSFRFKNMDNVTSPRHRRSISSFSMASKRGNKHSGYEEQIRRAQSAGIKRHTRSLTGTAAAAPSSSAPGATVPPSVYASDRVKASVRE